MEWETSIDIGTPPERVWEVLTDVESWPEWTASMRRVRRLDEGPLRVGSRARIRQPGLPATVWRVSELTSGRSFTWEAVRPGTRIVADHVLRSAGDGATHVTLAIRSTGIVSRLLEPLISATARRYVAMEAEGLKRRSEGTG